MLNRSGKEGKKIFNTFLIGAVVYKMGLNLSLFSVIRSKSIINMLLKLIHFKFFLKRSNQIPLEINYIINILICQIRNVYIKKLSFKKFRILVHIFRINVGFENISFMLEHEILHLASQK